MSQSPKPPQKKAKFIAPPNNLKKKIGDGGVGELVLNRCEDIIKESQMDFDKFTDENLVAIQTLVSRSKNKEISKDAFVEALIEPVMQLKANGRMFKYELVSDLSNILMLFLEKTTVVNNDLYAVTTAFEALIRQVVQRKIEGDGGQQGKILIQELNKACARYLKKYT